MKPPAALWKLRARELEEARLAVRRGEPEGLHDLRVALRHLAATASALGRRRLARRAKAIARSLSPARRLEVDRRLLERIGRLGFLSPDAATALAARWEKLGTRAARRRARATDGGKMQRLRRRLARLSGRGRGKGMQRLAAERRRAEEGLARSLEGRDDAALHRHRRTVRKARHLAEDLVLLGLPEPPEAPRERALEEALDRWNDLRGFRRRLAESREESERRGTVTLAAELDRLLAALEPALAAARAAAVTASRRAPRVVHLARPARALA